LWAWALENGLARHRTSGRRTRCRSYWCAGLWRLRRWRFVNRPGPGLRNDHARRRSHWCGRLRRNRCDRRGRLRWRRSNCFHWRFGLRRRRRRCRPRRRNRRDRSDRWRGLRRGSCRRRRRSNDRGRGPRGLRRDESRRGRSRRFAGRSRSCGACAGRGRGRNRRLHFSGGRTRHRRTGRRGWSRRHLLLLGDQFQYIARLRDVGEIDLGPDFVCLASRARRTGLRSRLAGSAEMGPHFLGLVLLQRTGMRFLLGDTHFGQHVKNRLALDFQFPGQIVDSNLTHPPFLCSAPSP